MRNTICTGPGTKIRVLAKGVKLDICEFTLRAMNMKKEQFVLDAGYAPAGVMRIGQLQLREHCDYIKP